MWLRLLWTSTKPLCMAGPVIYSPMTAVEEDEAKKVQGLKHKPGHIFGQGRINLITWHGQRIATLPHHDEESSGSNSCLYSNKNPKCKIYILLF